MEQNIYITLLQKVSDNLEIRFLSRVYLVGSFQEKFKEAMDIDIIMVMTKERMIRLFGETEFNHRRFRFMEKQKKSYEDIITDFDIDFKVQSEEEFLRRAGPQLKLGRFVQTSR